MSPMGLKPFHRQTPNNNRLAPTREIESRPSDWKSAAQPLSYIDLVNVCYKESSFI